MGTLDGKVGIVTGGSAGIGAATAFAFAAEGASVTVADLDVDRGEQVASKIREQGGSALFVRTDVSVDADAARMVEATLAEFGHLDIAFNNAGIEGHPASTHECSVDNWHRTLAVNLTGAWYCMRHELPPMLERGAGAIVNCSSVAGLVGFPTTPAYVASKFGVVGLTKTAALEYAERGIRVNAVCPGVIDTEMIERFTHGEPQALEQLAAVEPMARLGTPQEIAEMVVWLCSDKASFVTGQAIAVDGGFVAR